VGLPTGFSFGMSFMHKRVLSLLFTSSVLNDNYGESYKPNITIKEIIQLI